MAQKKEQHDAKVSLIRHALELNPELGEADRWHDLFKTLYPEHAGSTQHAENFRAFMVRHSAEIRGTTATEIQYTYAEKINALRADGTIMTVQEFCEHYRIPYSETRSYKLVTHCGYPTYNIASNVIKHKDESKDTEIRDAVRRALEGIKAITPKVRTQNKKHIVVTIADLHFGAYVDNLVKKSDYSIAILGERLNEVARIANTYKAQKVTVHILGDLIESFTGLNHKNSWKGLVKGMTGAEVVKLCTLMLNECLLSKINNLHDIKIVAGNHDRVTSDKGEDSDGDAANLIAWGLSLMKYNVEFNPFIITHTIGRISYILTHGHHGLSKRATKDIAWSYGVQGNYNLICEGHLHTKLNKTSKKDLHTEFDDSSDCSHVIVRSLFSGNSYSERLGFTTAAGFMVSEDNGSGKPNTYNYIL